jgi:hypothetical protein
MQLGDWDGSPFIGGHAFGPIGKTYWEVEGQRHPGDMDRRDWRSLALCGIPEAVCGPAFLGRRAVPVVA